MTSTILEKTMYSIIVKKDNVAIRPFLFLLDTRNRKKEFSNTTVCDYIIENYPELTKDYKSEQSFRSGYAGNFSLLFDSDESQEGRLNKNTKLIPKVLKDTFKQLTSVCVNIDSQGYFHITNIPDEKCFQILCVFFCLKPINATINKVIDLQNPENTWIPIIAKKLSCPVENFPPNQNQITGRGDNGRTSTLNRYTIYNRGNNWFDVIKPNYYNFESLRYKVFFHNLMIEQDNLYFCIFKTKNYDFSYEIVFQKGINEENGEIKTNNEWIRNRINFTDVLIIKKSILRDLLLENLDIPSSFQYIFTVIGNSLLFSDGTLIDLSPYLITDYSVLENSKNLNPNITVAEIEKEYLSSIKEKLKSKINAKNQIRRFSINGEESNTIRKFLALCFDGSFKIKDYERNKQDDTITFTEEKTCLILYNGTKYPDLVCIFLEDAEKIERKGNRTISEYIDYIWENNRRFEHLEFQVEAEYNVTSFRDHEQSKDKVLQSKYIFCENADSEFYKTKFDVLIPVVSIKDFE